MSFDDLMTDEISILKKDGRKLERIKASVQRSGIHIMNASKLLIEVGDIAHRKMSNGGEETYEVIDPQYTEGLGGHIPATYVLKVRKLGIEDAKKAIQNVTYNINGHNTHINQNSIDNSVNSVTNLQAVELLGQIRQGITASSIPPQDKVTATEILTAIGEQVRTGQPSKSVVITLLKALPTITSITDAVSALADLFK